MLLCCVIVYCLFHLCFSQGGSVRFPCSSFQNSYTGSVQIVCSCGVLLSVVLSF